MERINRSETQAVETREINNILSSLLKNTAAALAVSGIIVYAISSLSSAIFYHPLGVTISEVGLNYAAILAQSAGMITLAAILGLGGLAAVTSIYRRGGLSRRGRAVGLWVTVVAVILYLTISFFGGAITGLRYVLSGDGFSPSLLTPLRAAPVKLYPVEGDRLPGAEALAGRTFIYLGEANGITVLFDSNTGEAIRVPTSLIVTVAANCARVRPSVENCAS